MANPWVWDTKSRRYRNAETGRWLSHSKVAQLRDDFAATQRSWADVAASALGRGDWTVRRWELEIRDRLKRIYLSEYMLGRGGKNAMMQADYGRVGRMLKEQYDFLRAFALDVQAGAMSEAQIAARTQLYHESAIQAFERGKVAAYDGDLILPAYPADGGTPCRARCVLASTTLGSASVRGMYRRWYEGDFIEIVTALGDKVSITPNHPVLTESGWVDAGALDVGQRVFRCAMFDALSYLDPDIQGIPSVASEAYDALTNLRHSQRITGRLIDFHGDGSAGEIDIVDTNGLLGDDIDAILYEPFHHLAFALSDLLRSVSLSGDGMLAADFFRYRNAAHGLMSAAGQRASTLLTESGHPESCGVMSFALLNPLFGQPLYDDGPGAFQRFRDSLDALAGEEPCDHFIAAHINSWMGRFGDQEPTVPQSTPNGIASHDILTGEVARAHAPSSVSVEVIQVNRYRSSGHVYNLDTESGWYSANGIIVHNCKCRWSIRETKKAWKATWIRTASESCQGCVDRARLYNPYIVSKIAD
jgi:hypothetical protein